MGKGDKKTLKGKRRSKSYGNPRHKKQKHNEYISISNLRCWSIERLFAFIGNFDFTVSIQFKLDSESYQLFGKNITGLLIYNKRDRRILKSKISSGIKSETDGLVRFEAILKNGLSDTQIEKLSTNGFNNEDIDTVNYFPYKHNMTYFSKGRKKLEEPIIIEINNKEPIIDTFKFEYKLYKMRTDECDFLTDDEKIKMMALQKVLKIEEVGSKYIHNELVADRSVDFNFMVEDIQFHLGEIEMFSDKVLEEKSLQVKSIVDKEFQKAGIDPDNPIQMIKYLGVYSSLLYMGTMYQEKIVLYSTNPKIVLTVEGFMHVVFRHSHVLNIGERNQSKSRLPYSFSDIEYLIKSCLQSVEEDIKSHFKNHPTIRFSKFGDDLIRFNGDYYEVHINPRGVLETFYNHKN